MHFFNAETGQIEHQLTNEIPWRWFDLQCTASYRVSDNVQLLGPSSDAQLAHAKGMPTDANALSGVGDFFDDDLRKVTARFSERQRC